MKTTLLIPVLNEIEGMKVILPRIKKEWDEPKRIGGSKKKSRPEFFTPLETASLHPVER